MPVCARKDVSSRASSKCVSAIGRYWPHPTPPPPHPTPPPKPPKMHFVLRSSTSPTPFYYIYVGICFWKKRNPWIFHITMLVDRRTDEGNHGEFMAIFHGKRSWDIPRSLWTSYRGLVDYHGLLWINLDVPSKNQPWLAGKFLNSTEVSSWENHRTKWEIFQHQVWLPESTSLRYLPLSTYPGEIGVGNFAKYGVPPCTTGLTQYNKQITTKMTPAAEGIEPSSSYC